MEGIDETNQPYLSQLQHPYSTLDFVVATDLQVLIEIPALC